MRPNILIATYISLCLIFLGYGIYRYTTPANEIKPAVEYTGYWVNTSTEGVNGIETISSLQGTVSTHRKVDGGYEIEMFDTILAVQKDVFLPTGALIESAKYISMSEDTFEESNLEEFLVILDTWGLEKLALSAYVSPDHTSIEKVIAVTYDPSD